MTTPADPLSLDRFTVRLDEASDQVVIASRSGIPLTSPVADSILRERDASVIWYTSDRYGYVVFPTTDAGWAMAQTFCDQLNELCAESDAEQADAEQADALIDSAASLAERIEAEATDGLTAGQRRGLAAYRRAAEAPPYQWGPNCGERWAIGDRVRIGDPADPYHTGIMVALGLATKLQGQTATVILSDSPKCPLIALLDDDEPIALPHPALYVRRAE